MDSEEMTWEIDLGSDDCETCGTNFNSIDVTFDDGGYRYSLQVGCYGGEIFQTGDRDELVEYLQDKAGYIADMFPASMSSYWKLVDEVDAFRPTGTKA